MKRVKIISDTIQEFWERYYFCGNYFQKNGKRLHREVWKFYKGEIPKGFIVHHIKEDKSKNQIEDFELMIRAKHVLHHIKKRKPIPITKQCREAANKWHGSEDGRKWHNKHYENTKKNLQKKIERECSWCGEIFESKRKNVDVFCSGKCRTASRKASGIDDIEKICEVCSKFYMANKYSKVKTCSKICKRKL